MLGTLASFWKRYSSCSAKDGNQRGSCFVSCERTLHRNAFYVWYSPAAPSPGFSFGHIWNWAPMSGSQNSGLGYESNLLSALFVFTENPMNPSRKHLLKCKRQGELIHTLNLAHRTRLFFCSPKGMLTRFCGESDKFNRYKRVSSSRGVCMYVCVSVCVQFTCVSGRGG